MMNGELKSKFRDRLKFFKKLFFLKKQKGSAFDFNNDSPRNSVDPVKSYYNSKRKKIYVKKKNIVGSNQLMHDFNKNISVIDNSNKVVKVKYVRKKRKSVGIDNSLYSDFIDDPRLTFYHNIIYGNKYKNYLTDVSKINNNNNYNFDKNKYIQNKDKEILLNIIVGKLDDKSKKMFFKLDNLYSDYYKILNFSNEEIDKEDCEKKLKEIEKIKKEIDDITKQFNIINDDKYLDNIIELDDSNLIDDIIRYKNLCSKLIDKRDVYENYKKIENYDRLNTYLEKITKRIEELEEKKEKKKEEIEKRDKDFDLFKNFVTSVDVKNEKYFSIINSQVDICNNILKNVEKIFRSESVDYRLKGLGDLVSSSFKYLFYLSISPFRGIFPSIAINALATKHMIRNIRNNLELEEIRRVNYYAKDYENEINRNIYDINNLNNLLYSTLDDIDNLKEEFKDKYGKYIDKIPEYKEIYKKIEKIENMVKFNLDRVKKIEKSLNKSKEKNKNKLIKIKQLNSKNN